MLNYRSIISTLSIATITLFTFSCNGYDGPMITDDCGKIPKWYLERECPKEYDVCGHGYDFALDPVLAENGAAGLAALDLARQVEIKVADRLVRGSQEARDGLSDAVAALVKEDSFATEVKMAVRGAKKVKDMTHYERCEGDAHFWTAVGVNSETLDVAGMINKAIEKSKDLTAKQKELLQETKDWANDALDF